MGDVMRRANVWLRWLLLSTSVIVVTSTACNTVVEDTADCFQIGRADNYVEVDCPSDLTVHLLEVTYYIAKSEECPSAWQNDSCSAQTGYEKKPEATKGCTGNTCFFPVKKKDEEFIRSSLPNCAGGHYLRVRYTCKGTQRSISTCDRTPITSNQVTIKNSIARSCACQFIPDLDTEIQFKVTDFVVPDVSNPCDHRLITWSSSQEVKAVCSFSSGGVREMTFTCGSGVVHIQYNQTGSYVVDITASYKANFSVQCGLDLIQINETLLTYPPSTASTTSYSPTPARNKSTTTTTTTPNTTATTPTPTTTTTTTTRTLRTPQPRINKSDPIISIAQLVGIIVGVFAAIAVVIGVIMGMRHWSKKQLHKPRKPQNTFNATIGQNQQGGTFTVGDMSTLPRVKAPPKDTTYL